MNAIKQRIIIVEDEALLRHSFVSVLNQSSRYVVVGEYDNLKDATKRIYELSDLIILLDVHLFGEQTIESINQLKRINPYNRILMLSSDVSSKTVISCLKNGADGYLAKEDAVLALGSYLDQCMKFDHVLSPAAANSLVYYLQSPNSGTNNSTELHSFVTNEMTNAQKLVYRELVKGKSYQDIGESLGVSKNTVGQHVQRIYKVLGVHSRAELMSGNIPALEFS